MTGDCFLFSAMFHSCINRDDLPVFQLITIMHLTNLGETCTFDSELRGDGYSHGPPVLLGVTTKKSQIQKFLPHDTLCQAYRCPGDLWVIPGVMHTPFAQTKFKKKKKFDIKGEGLSKSSCMRVTIQVASVNMIL